MSTFSAAGSDKSEETVTKADSSTTIDIVVAQPPFHDVEETDLILRSSDQIHFYVSKAIMSFASPVFADMASLPEGDKLNIQERIDHRPCVPVLDHSEELYQLLSWVDPRGVPSLELDDMKKALRLADKYGMNNTVCRIGVVLEALDNLMKKDCITVYAIAVQCGFTSLIEKAAHHSLNIAVQDIPNVPEFTNITGTAVQNFYTYRLACNRAAQTFISSGAWTQDQYLRAFSVSIPTCCAAEGRATRFGTMHLQLMRWFAVYIHDIQEAVAERPVPATVRDPASHRDTLVTMAACNKCRNHIPTFLSFIEFVATGIENAIANIKISSTYM
ncbi:hypothetical protein CPB83DRAFT_788398 [Crepidotus variabilis]|uniref:BTB domain-containing protein n=1 Tax=Crepidotus variabilis TaxID=179855 RepID=A0A9P6JR45_9AGAR|nr:hypothetical protein CPB83DRAFT_788398 [Crepidotus variabilis]